MYSKHHIRSLTAKISSVDDVVPGVVLLESVLRRDTPYLPQAAGLRPLFSAALARVDMSDPSVTEQIDAARLRAVQEVQEINSRELGELTSRYAASLQRLERAISTIERVVASEVVDLALLVASELIHSEMRQNPALVLSCVQQALASVPHDGKVSVRMNPDDLAAVRAKVQAESSDVLEWLADSTLGHGDCIVETPRRIIDASIDARIAAVRDTLVRTLMSEERKVQDLAAKESP